MKIERTMSAVYDALPPSSAKEFRTDLTAVLEASVAHLDVDELQMRLDAVIGRYWAVASAFHSPNAEEVTAAGHRWGQGDNSDTVSMSGKEYYKK